MQQSRNLATVHRDLTQTLRLSNEGRDKGQRYGERRQQSLGRQNSEGLAEDVEIPAMAMTNAH